MPEAGEGNGPVLGARLALARRDVARARQLLESLSPTNLRDEIVLHLLAARSEAARGRPEERDRELLAAARLAEPERYLHTFVDEVPELLTRLRELAKDHYQLSSLVEAIDVADELRHVPAVQPLTDREAAVLRYLPSGLTSPEIAAQLDVSANTLKTHTRSLYRKLGARSRSAAVAAAKRSGLL